MGDEICGPGGLVRSCQFNLFHRFAPQHYVSDEGETNVDSEMFGLIASTTGNDQYCNFAHAYTVNSPVTKI